MNRYPPDEPLKARFRALRENLIPLAKDPYERRAFIYFDIISWLESKIRLLEEKGRGDAGEYLPETSEGDNKTASPSMAPSADVVKALEGWLRTIDRRKTEMSAGPEGE